MKYVKFLILLLAHCNATTWKAIILIGPHKTGSTQLQAGIVQNANVFRTLNYSVILSHGPKDAAHFAFTLKNQRRSGYFNVAKYNQAVTAIRKCNSHLILASEELDNAQPSHIATLKDHLSCYETTIVAIHRSSLHHIRSYWSQFNRRTRMPTDILEWFTKGISTIGSDIAIGYNFRTVLDQYAVEFGRSRIKVLSFEKSIANYRSPFRAFLAYFNFPNALFREPPLVENQSPSSFELDCLRHVALYAKLSGKKFRHDRSRSLRIIAEYAKLLPFRELTVVLPPCVADEIQTIERIYNANVVIDRSCVIRRFCAACITDSNNFLKTWNTLIEFVLT